MQHATYLTRVNQYPNVDFRFQSDLVIISSKSHGNELSEKVKYTIMDYSNHSPRNLSLIQDMNEAFADEYDATIYDFPNEISLLTQDSRVEMREFVVK